MDFELVSEITDVETIATVEGFVTGHVCGGSTVGLDGAR